MSYIPKKMILWSDDHTLGDSTEYMEGGRCYAINQPYLESFVAPSNPTHGAVVIFPGGGMKTLAWETEGHQIAQWVTNSLNLNAFVVHYRLAPSHYPHPQYDARQAIRLVRKNADSWEIDPNAIGVMGFSIGGHLALQMVINPDSLPLAEGEQSDWDARPNWGILGYPVSTMNADLAHQNSTLALFGEQPSVICSGRMI